MAMTFGAVASGWSKWNDRPVISLPRGTISVQSSTTMPHSGVAKSTLSGS